MTSETLFINHCDGFFTKLTKTPLLDRKQESLEETFPSYVHTDNCGPMISQKDVFSYDLKNYSFSFIEYSTQTLFSIANSITLLIASPFAILVDIYRTCAKKISFSTSLKNIYVIPVHVIIHSINLAIITPIILALRVVAAVQKTVGFLAWHTGEFLVRQVKSIFNKSPDNKFSVLSHKIEYRNYVYNSIGITLLAASALCINILPIQLLALPILAGSLYGTINNLFTVKKCPEYYTMGHPYEGKSLRNHAIKTNSMFIKPFVTGCYATTFVSKAAAIFIAAAGALPFTAAVLPITYAAAMIGTLSVISIIAGGIFSKIKERNIQKNIEEYAELIGVKITDEDLERTWEEFKAYHYEVSNQKLHSIVDETERFNFTNKLVDIDTYITKYSTALPNVDFSGNPINKNQPLLPLKYIAPWHSNATRNGTGYVVMRLGAIISIAATVALRILIL